MVSLTPHCQGPSCPHHRRFYSVDKIKHCDSYYVPNFNLPPTENCTYGKSAFDEGVNVWSLKICPLKK